VFSQKDTTHIAHNIVYVEIGGIAGYGSLNYERAFFIKTKWTLSARVGISTMNLKDYTNKFNPDILVPFAVYGSYGSNHKAEIGIGQLYENVVRADLSEFKPIRVSHFNTVFSVAYKYQRKHGGLFIRVAYSPIIDYEGVYRNWGGVSIGYSF
jgi:hypothetical protein